MTSSSQQWQTTVSRAVLGLPVSVRVFALVRLSVLPSPAVDDVDCWLGSAPGFGWFSDLVRSHPFFPWKGSPASRLPDMWFVVFSHRLVLPHPPPLAPPGVVVFICRLWLSCFWPMCLVVPWMHLPHDRRMEQHMLLFGQEICIFASRQDTRRPTV